MAALAGAGLAPRSLNGVFRRLMAQRRRGTVRQAAFSQCRELQAPIAKARDLPADHVLVKATGTAAVHPTTGPKNRMIIVDGTAVLCRAYYKLAAKTGDSCLDVHPDADWVLTVFTALTTMLSLFELSPTHAVIVFDHRGPTFRHTLFPDYKKNRPPTPETIINGLDHVRPALVSMGIKVLEVPGVEADDVIATVATSVASSETRVRIVSPDKDFFQVLSPAVRLLRFAPKGSEMVSFGLEDFTKRFGNLKPTQYVDVLSLIGDTCDNVPGIPGIGEKTAIELIQQYGSVENLLQHREKVTIKRAVKGLLADNGEALLSKRLVTLRADLPTYMIPFTMDDYVWRKPHDDGSSFFELLRAMSCLIGSSMHVEMQERVFKLWENL